MPDVYADIAEVVVATRNASELAAEVGNMTDTRS